MKRRIIGIDVGKNGGIVVYDTENNKLLECIKMPPTPKDLLDFLSIYKENSVCYLERVNGMTGQSASASFVFGEGYGQLTMGLIACGIPTVTVSPQTWQKTIGLRNTDKLIVTDIITEMYEERGIYDNVVESLYESGKGLRNGVITSGKIRKKMPVLTDFYKKALEKNKGNRIAEHRKAYRIILDSLKDRVKELYYCPECIQLIILHTCRSRNFGWCGFNHNNFNDTCEEEKGETGTCSNLRQ